MTLWAYANWIATSSTSTVRTEAPPAPTTGAAVSPVPKPPMMMLASERFIASAISLVRMLPEAPTSAPAVMSATLPMTKPAMATAVPVKAFSSEMTTGISAPPIGSTMVTPKPRAARVRTIKTGTFPDPVMSQMAPPTMRTASTALTTRAPRKTIGALFTQPCSFPAAMSEPEKVTAPMRTSSAVATATVPDTLVAPALVASFTNSLIATMHAAPPPTALNMLTSCGIAVIFTVRAL